MKKILIVKTSALGDIVHAYPVVDYLHHKFPDVRIDWVVEAPNAELVQAHPYVHRAIPIATKAWRKALFKNETFKAVAAMRRQLREQHYDVVFDLQGNLKSGLIVSQAKSPCKVGFGIKSVPEWSNILFTNKRYNPDRQNNIRYDYLSMVTAFFGDSMPTESGQIALKISQEQQAQIDRVLANPLFKNKPKVLVCSGSAWPNKQLTTETLAAFLGKVQKKLGCAFLFVWGSSAEHEAAKQLQNHFQDASVVVDRMKLSMLQNLMGECDLVVAMDSLPLHLAGSTKTPTFSVFGASSADKYKPIGPNHLAYQGACPYGRTFVKRCPILRTCPTGACIHDLHAQDLFASFNEWNVGGL